MNRAAELESRRAGSAPPPPGVWAISTRWYARVGLLLLGTALLTASFAPVNQFYLSWIGLVPWLIVLDGTRSKKSAFFWSWLGGTFFFIANMWWMYYVTSYGMVALMAILGLYWGYAGIIVRGAGLVGNSSSKPSLFKPHRLAMVRILLIAAIWVAASEWFRGTWPWHGLPWLYLGSTQTPALWMCQIADITGVAGLSFLIVVINAWVALWILNRVQLKGLVSAGIMTVLMLAGVIGYGAYRLRTEPGLLVPGPEVMVVQSNFPQSNTGAKGATQADLYKYHYYTTSDALARHPGVDLAVWSETMMPPLNSEATRLYPDFGYVDSRLSEMTSGAHTALLTGAEAASRFVKGEPRQRRNSAFYYDRAGQQFAEHYDKIHLVPYGEFIPFKDSVPWLYKLAIHFGPPDMEAYSLVPGDEQHLTVFPLKDATGRKAWRFVTPICFEDIDADICADMFRPEKETPDLKRADFLVNITNDGWFTANENPQHLQAAAFRSIENRVPTARSVNTGISGFIDPLGHTYGLLAAHTEGLSTQKLSIDPRVTVFTRIGPLFSWICAGITVALVAISTMMWAMNLVRSRK
jgi:apolipoprotein N-acyltransferase